MVGSADLYHVLYERRASCRSGVCFVCVESMQMQEIHGKETPEETDRETHCGPSITPR